MRDGLCYFFFNDTATTEIYTLSLHDALPISVGQHRFNPAAVVREAQRNVRLYTPMYGLIELRRSEEHTSELQSRQYLVCRLLLEKKKIKKSQRYNLFLCIYVHLSLSLHKI